MAYAEVSDLEARLGRELTTDEQARAEVLLGDASAMLDALMGDAAAEKPDLLCMVNCNMVIRVMGIDSAESCRFRIKMESSAYGVDSMSITAGPYAQTWNYNAPSGDMYLTKSEKLMLGLYGGYIGTIRPMMAGDHDD